MKHDDLAFALQLVKLAGWDVDSAELELLLACEPEGCFVAEQAARRIGIVTATSYGPLGWIGTLIVEPESRRHGVGSHLIQRAMSHLTGKGARTIRLLAESGAIALYEGLGFEKECRWLRYRGQGIRCHARGAEAMQPAQLGEVFRLDARCFGADRSRVLHRVFKGSRGLAFVSYDRGAVVGYIMARPTALGAKIGPWICDADELDETRVESLLRAVLNAVKHRPVSVGTLDNNPMSQEILKRYGFGEALPGALMRWGESRSSGNPQARLAIGTPAMG